MGYTNYPYGVTSFGVPVGGAGMPSLFNNGSAAFPRRYIFIDGTYGANGNNGFSSDNAKATIAAAVAIRLPGDCFVLAPGTYAENVVVTRYYTTAITGGGPLWIVGLGSLGSVAIAPASGIALDNREDDVTLVNLDLASASASAKAFVNFGSRLRAFQCKFEGADTSGATVIMGPGTVAQRAAYTHGNCGDTLYAECEFAWGYDGVRIVGTDYGAATQVFFERCRFHNLTHASFAEAVGSGGAAATTYRNLEVADSVFDTAEDGTAPTAWFLLNASNSNTGIATRNSFPTAINSGKNLVSTAMKWVCNYHTGGISTAQPS